MDPDLEQAYRQTTYVALTPHGELHIRIGEPHHELDALLASHDAEEWAYITAWNPKSERLTDKENRARQRQLEDELHQAGYAVFAGRGVPHNDDWDPEESLLVAGIPRQHAVDFGMRYDQNAIVYGRSSGLAELVWCVSEDDVPG